MVWRLQKWLQIGEEKKMTKGCEIVDPFLYGIIKLKQQKISSRKSQPEEEEEEFNILTNVMIENEPELGTTKSDKFLKDTAFNLLSAGRNSVGTAITWFLWLVATHPSVEEKIVEQIKQNLQTNGDHQHGNWRAFSIEELNNLVYLHGAICETLRLYPSGPFEHKLSLEADVLPSGHRINADTRIIFSFYAMGRMEEIWGRDCLEYRPERWISDRGGIVHVPSYKFPAFLAGPVWART